MSTLSTSPIIGSKINAGLIGQNKRNIKQILERELSIFNCDNFVKISLYSTP